MQTLSRAGSFTTCTSHPFPRSSQHPRPQFAPFTRNPTVSVLKTGPPPALELVEEEALKIFLEDRALNGDFISTISDMLWQKGALKSVELVDTPQQRKQRDDMVSVGVDAADELAASSQQTDQDVGADDDGGFLKLLRTREWASGDNPAPINKKAKAKAFRDDSERRKKLNLLQYEAIKREMMLLSVAIGTACSGYCLVALSVQAAISYAVGVLFSCLYLQLLYRHADNLSKEAVPQIFMKKKTKKIGIRSEDLEDFLERTIKGSGMALSSPRLVIPAAIYGLWILCHQSFVNNLFDFQLTPAMVGLFVYKAAALVQVYRDNEDLQLIFPDDEGSGGR